MGAGGKKKDPALVADRRGFLMSPRNVLAPDWYHHDQPHKSYGRQEDRSPPRTPPSSTPTRSTVMNGNNDEVLFRRNTSKSNDLGAKANGSNLFPCDMTGSPCSSGSDDSPSPARSRGTESYYTKRKRRRKASKLGLTITSCRIATVLFWVLVGLFQFRGLWKTPPSASLQVSVERVVSQGPPCHLSWMRDRVSGRCLC